MSRWLTRLFGRGGAAAVLPPPAEPPRAAPPRRPEAAASDAAAQLPRRPLIDRDGRLAGFEFPLPEVMLRRLDQGAGPTVLMAHLGALVASTRSTVDAGRVALIVVPAALPPQRLAVPALRECWRSLWLAFDAGAFDAAEAPALAALAAAGARAGARQAAHAGSRFVHVDAAGLARDAACAAVDACRRAAPGQDIVVGGLGDVDDVEAVLAAGATLAAGHCDRQRAKAGVATMPPAIGPVTRLLNQLLHGAELPAIAAELRADVSLSYELLRHANSPLLGLSRQVDATDQAVLLLGRDALYRWLCARLLAALPGRPTARALREIALTRALLFERLAPACDQSPTALYTLGLLSLLDVMVPMPMAEAIAPLNLPAPTGDALVRRTGLLGTLLRLATRLESGDLASAEALAPGFGGLAAVLAAHESAWQDARRSAAELWPGR